MCEGVDGHMQLASMAMNILDGSLQFVAIKIQTGKVAGIGVIFEADKHGIGAVVDGRLECRQAAGRADEFG